MSTSIIPVDTAAPDLAAGSPELPQYPGSQHAAQDDRPKPKYLDPQWKYEGVPDTQFYKDYPPDAWGEEALPNARVWKIYRDETTKSVAATLKTWNGTLDVLLIFAGLFSAMSTAFIVEAYKSLQPDYTEYITKYLYAASKSNFAVDGGTIMPLPAGDSLRPPDNFVRPSSMQRWTNGLWFTSLVVSLSVALLCILIKQWLEEYHGRTTRSAPSLRDWARCHQLYYHGPNMWGVPALISLLPLLLHISLFLFLAGLVVFLRPLDVAIANTLLAILALMLILSLVIPVWCVSCPSYLPLRAQAQYDLLLNLSILISHFIYSLRFRRRWSRFAGDNVVVACIHRATGPVSRRLQELLTHSRQSHRQETCAIDAQQFTLDGWMLSILLVLTNTTDIISAGVEAIGAISAESTLEAVVRDVPNAVIVEHTCWENLHTDTASNAFAVLTYARRVWTFWALALTQKSGLNSADQYGEMQDLYSFLGLDGMMAQLIAVSKDCSF